MRRHASTIVFAVCLIALFTAAAAGCSSSGTPGGGQTGGTNGGGMMGSGTGGSGNGSGGGMMGSGGPSGNSFSSAGERIYLTGVGSDGQRIPRSGARVSQGSLMMGGGGCGSCHGADGRGGTIRMMSGTGVETPDITYEALTGEGFTETAISTAIRDGLDESGKPLSEIMPRWQMSDVDLAATIAYLKELGAR